MNILPRTEAYFRRAAHADDDRFIERFPRVLAPERATLLVMGPPYEPASWTTSDLRILANGEPREATCRFVNLWLWRVTTGQMLLPFEASDTTTDTVPKTAGQNERGLSPAPVND